LTQTQQAIYQWRNPAECLAGKKSALTLLEVYQLLRTKRRVHLTHAFAPEIPHWIGLLTDVGQVPEFGALTVATFPKPRTGTGFPARIFAILL
jgi:kynurenine formamidase